MPKPQNQRKNRSRPPQGPPPGPPDGPVFLPPLRPHRNLFYVSAALVALCLTTWLVLYFTTVYKQ
jgi:hypothetical protein